MQFLRFALASILMDIDEPSGNWAARCSKILRSYGTRQLGSRPDVAHCSADTHKQSVRRRIGAVSLDALA